MTLVILLLIHGKSGLFSCWMALIWLRMKWPKRFFFLLFFPKKAPPFLWLFQIVICYSSRIHREWRATESLCVDRYTLWQTTTFKPHHFSSFQKVKPTLDGNCEISAENRWDPEMVVCLSVRYGGLFNIWPGRIEKKVMDHSSTVYPT